MVTCGWTAQVEHTQKYTASLLVVKGGQNSRTSGGWDSYPKQTGQIRSEWRERSWKPSRADPVLRLSHIPPYPSLSSPSPFSPFHHLPASSFPHLACHKSHFSLFFKQYRHVWGGWGGVMVFDGLSPSVWRPSSCSGLYCLSSTATQQDLSKVGSAFTM